MKLKNRVFRSATWEAAASSGEVTETYTAIHTTLAEGGVAAIICGFMAGMEAEAIPIQTHIFHDRYIDGLKRHADAVHAASDGVRLIAQIGQLGRTIGPSDTGWTGPVRPLSTAEVEGVVRDFAAAIGRAKAAGWDGVEIHGAHDYLLSAFLSPATNRRTDSYGGSVDSRVRIIREIVATARELVGGDFPIQIKLNSEEGVEGGIGRDEFAEQARLIAATGVDALNISGRTPSHPDVDEPGEESYFLPAAETLDVKIPIILVGGNRHVDRMEKVIGRGTVEFLAMARPLIREPDLPTRWLEGRGPAEADCIHCNGCREHLATGQPMRCVQLA
jgi:2,4-dienoyl-CoA reductase-like NADH-dependent reductase (Old Yellow Enzyme family)